MRILHFPNNVGGHPWGVAKAERRLGFDSVCVLTGPHAQGLHGDFVLNPTGLRILDEMLKWGLLIYALIRVDAVHFNFGMKFFTYKPVFESPPRGPLRKMARALYRAYCSVIGEFDLWLLKAFGKKIFVTFQGDDARLGEYSKANFEVHFYSYVPAGYYSEQSDARKKELFALWDKYADEIFYLNPDLGWVLPKRSRFFAYGHVDFQSVKPALRSVKRPLIVHAPTHRDVKGTSFILKAFDSLRARGLEFDVKLVEGLPFDQALKIYEQADIVVDQVLAGWYGGFAVEAMALGKPVVSYIRVDDLGFIPPEMRLELPIVNASPDQIEERLAELISSPDLRTDIGRRGREFVVKWHTPDRYLEPIVKSLRSSPRTSTVAAP